MLVTRDNSAEQHNNGSKRLTKHDVQLSAVCWVTGALEARTKVFQFLSRQFERAFVRALIAPRAL